MYKIVATTNCPLCAGIHMDMELEVTRASEKAGAEGEVHCARFGKMFMYKPEYYPTVSSFVKPFTEELFKQLLSDEARHGSAWLKLPRQGQEERIFEAFARYKKEFDEGQPMPWLKIAGNALIGWLRDKYPDLWR